VAFASAVMLALAAHRWRLVEDVLAPAVAALKSVPIVCIIVLLLMWVGSRSVSASPCSSLSFRPCTSRRLRGCAA